VQVKAVALLVKTLGGYGQSIHMTRGYLALLAVLLLGCFSQCHAAYDTVLQNHAARHQNTY
jgi:hypothetical protein